MKMKKFYVLSLIFIAALATAAVSPEYYVSLYKGTAKVSDIVGSSPQAAWDKCISQATTTSHSCKTPVIKFVAASSSSSSAASSSSSSSTAPTGALWVYNNGVSYFGADYSYNDISVNWTTGTVVAGNNGGLQPAFPGNGLDISSQNYWIVSIKPQTVCGFNVRQVRVGDIFDLAPEFTLTQSKYGPSPMVAGQWNTYKVPLADFAGTAGKQNSFYKIYMTPLGACSYAFNAMGFTAK
jgi:hypothetical protein